MLCRVQGGGGSGQARFSADLRSVSRAVCDPGGLQEVPAGIALAGRLPLSSWFAAACLVTTHGPGFSAALSWHITSGKEGGVAAVPAKPLTQPVVQTIEGQQAVDPTHEGNSAGGPWRRAHAGAPAD
jgi:hypothetical protein